MVKVEINVSTEKKFCYNMNTTSNHSLGTMPMREYQYELYPNSPLVEVVFEIRFMGELAIECERHKFYELVRKDYPRLLIPKVTSPGVALALEPYRFEKEDRSSGILLSVNKLGFYSRKHQGCKTFEKEMLRIFSIFKSKFSVDGLNRTGLRYINVIPFSRENGLVPLKRFLNVDFCFPKSISIDRMENLSTVFVTKIKDDSLTIKLESVTETEGKREAFVLDFDYAKTRGLSFSEVKAYYAESHSHISSIFEDLITGDYRKFLREETV